jgi:hypothetical protein
MLWEVDTARTPGMMSEVVALGYTVAAELAASGRFGLRHRSGQPPCRAWGKPIQSCEQRTVHLVGWFVVLMEQMMLRQRYCRPGCPIWKATWPLKKLKGGRMVPREARGLFESRLFSACLREAFWLQEGMGVRG